MQQTDRIHGKVIELGEGKNKERYAKCTVYDHHMVSSPSGSYKERIHYTVHERIGQGSFGIVVVTVDIQFKKPSARKSIIKSRYRREEPESMWALRDSNICPKLHAVVETPSKYHIFMEVVSGVTLVEFIGRNRDNRYRTKTLCAILKHVLEMHGRGFVHKDLKGENILIEEVEGTKMVTKVKLIDLGNSEQLKLDERNYEQRRQDLIDILRHYLCLCKGPSLLGSSKSIYTPWNENLQNFLHRVNQDQLFGLIDAATAKEEKEEAGAQLLSFLANANLDEFQDMAADPQISPVHLAAAIAQAKMRSNISVPAITGQKTSQPCATTCEPYVPECSTASNMPLQLPSPSSLPQPTFPVPPDDFTTESPMSTHAMDPEDMPLEINLGYSTSI